MSRDIGVRSGTFVHAEGWRRRFHLGLCAPDADPLAEALGPCYLINPRDQREVP